MNEKITLPVEIVESFYENDSVRVIIPPPVGLPYSGWLAWVHESFPFPVTHVEQLSEKGRWLLAVTLSDEDEAEASTPKTFRLVPPSRNNSREILPIVNITIDGEPWTPPPPPPPQPPAAHDVCERPVRVRADTHKKIRALSQKLGLSIASTIDRAITAMIDAGRG